MLTKKQYLAIFLISIIPLMFYAGVRDNLIGADGYHFYNYVCETNYIDNGFLEQTMPIAIVIFNLMPCNMFFVKISMWAMLFLSSVIVAHFGKLFYPKHGWMAGIIVFMSPWWILQFFEFEDDIFGYPLLFLSLYFFIKGVKERNRKYQAMGVGLALLAGLIWKGAIIYVLGYTMFYPILFLFSIAIMNYGGFNVFGSIVNIKAGLDKIPFEETPILGVFLPVILIWGYLSIESVLLYPLAYFTVLAMLRAKLAIHLFPLLAVCLMKRFEHGTDRQRQTVVLIVLFMIVIPVSASLVEWRQMPTNDVMNSVQNAISYSEEMYGTNEIYNDWSVGYYVEYHGGVPSHMGSPLDQNFEDVTGIVLTTLKLNHCEALEQGQYYIIYDCRPKSI